MNHYRAIFISDLHLGYGRSQSDAISSFLEHHESDDLYLVGDVIDLQRMTDRVRWPEDSTRVVDQVMSKSENGTRVHYVIGNHDETLRRFLEQGLSFGHIPFSNHVDHTGLDRNRYLVIHGDQVENPMRGRMSWPLMFVCHKGYIALLNLNSASGWILSRFGLKGVNFVAFIRRHSRLAQSFTRTFEESMAEYARERGYDGVVCGHIHSPQMRTIDGIEYRNCGDWLENCSAVVEHHDGRWEIIRWQSEQDREQHANDTGQDAPRPEPVQPAVVHEPDQPVNGRQGGQVGDQEGV